MVTRLRGVVDGVIAGANGAACMTVVREVARRLDLIDATPPQALRASLPRSVGGDADGARRRLANHAVHLAVSAAAGGAYGAVWGRRAQPSFAGGVLYGIGVWMAALAAFVPLPGHRRSHTAMPQNAVNLVAHVVYGAVLPLLIQGMRRNDARRVLRADNEARRIG